MKYLYTIFIFIFSFIILSCAKKDESSSSGTTTTTTELEGTWITSCTVDSDNYSHLYKIVVTGTDAVETDEVHSDTTCSTDSYKWEYTYSSLSIEDEVTFDDGTKGHKYTINIQSYNFTAQTSAYVSALNSASTCGINDWVINTAKDVQGLTCGSTTYPTKNTTGKGLYNLVGNNAFFGGFITTGSYPTSVSTNITFVKQ
tara:strand:- start:62 stop:661 length:600 start_codon:yes stop_codon:yes gene_type:complete